MTTLPSLIEKHNLISETRFQLKSFLLILKRKFQNLSSPVKRFKNSDKLKNEPVISISESELWNIDDNEQNLVLTMGKIENLRIAVKRINGIKVEGNQIFSFWKHLGNPNLTKGYVLGREIREGCTVATIAGGLCQLSNALYDAALKAGFEIVERHRHSKVIKGSLAEKDRDATVKWNYVDLRFKAKHSFRIEIDITPDKLVVKFRSAEKNYVPLNINTGTLLQSSKLNDCYSCGNFGCFKHPGKVVLEKHKPVTTFILDEKWSEYDDYIKTIATDKDFYIMPFSKNGRYSWSIRNTERVKYLSFATVQREWNMRFSVLISKNIFSAQLNSDKRFAKAVANYIPIETTHLIVSQNLLPFLWDEGVFGGRTYDVIMNRLPIEKLHQQLDEAHKKYPNSETLNDFRAPHMLIDSENSALTRSRSIITPHSEIASIFNNKSIKLDWVMPKANGLGRERGNKIFFPASALGRKGAYEVKRLAKELNIEVVFIGKATEDKNFWDGVKAELETGNTFKDIGVVVYPAYVEHQPRLLLKALALGIHVVATTACGLSPTDGLTIVPVGDYNALKNAVINYSNDNH